MSSFKCFAVVLCLVFVFTAFVFPASAGVVHLNNGDRITGEILSLSDDLVRIQPAFSAAFEIAREHVASVETDDAGDASLQSAVIEAVEEAPVPESRSWHSKIGLNSNFSRGNTDSQLINLQADYGMEKEQHRYSADLASIREEKEGDTVKEQDRLNLGYNYLYSEKWFFAMNATLEQDPVALLDHRVSLNPAIGYDIWNEGSLKLNVQLGAGYSDEQVDGEDESGSQVDWRLNYSQQMFDGAMEVFHKHNIYRNLDGRENTVFNSQSGVRYDLTDQLFMNVQLNYDYDTEPAPGTDSKDLTFLIGAGMTL